MTTTKNADELKKNENLAPDAIETPTETPERKGANIATPEDEEQSHEQFVDFVTNLVNEQIDTRLKEIVESIDEKFASIKEYIKKNASKVTTTQSVAQGKVSLKEKSQEIMQKYGLLHSQIATPEMIKALEISDDEKSVLLDNAPNSLDDFNIVIQIADLPDYLVKLVEAYGINVSKLGDSKYLKEQGLDKSQTDSLNRFIAKYTEMVLQQSGAKLSPEQVQELKAKSMEDKE